MYVYELVKMLTPDTIIVIKDSRSGRTLATYRVNKSEALDRAKTDTVKDWDFSHDHKRIDI